MQKKLIFVATLLSLPLAIMFFVRQTQHSQPVPIAPTAPVVINPPPPPLPEPPKEFTYEDALASINADSIKKMVYYLASEELEGRMSGKKGNVIAADYLKKEYDSYGLPTMYHRFSIDRLNSGPKKEIGDDYTQNVYAWILGEDQKQIVVVGAHMDHIGYGPSMSRSRQIAIHPGADDNASGTAALLAVAKAFSMVKGKLKRTIVFQSYSAEEMGLIGSRFYCNNPVFPLQSPNINSHIFMLNYDMVGTLGSGIWSTGFYSGNSSLEITKYIRELDQKYSFAKDITSQGSGGSDHASFYNKRVPVAFLHTGLHSRYHTPADKADTLNYEGIEKVAKYSFELLWKVVQNESYPAFNHENFKEMEYTHDHGSGVEFHSYHKH